MVIRKNYQDAMKLYDQILDKDPENIDALSSKAQCLQKVDSNSFPKALKLYEKALELDEKDFETNFNIGILYYQRKQQEDMEKALTYLKKANELDPYNKIVLYDIAVIHEEKEEYALAEEYYRKLLKIDAKNVRVLVNLGV